MKANLALAALVLSTSVFAQQPQRPSDAEIDARFQVMSARLTNEISRSAALEARLMIVEAELAKVRKDAATKPAVKPQPK